MKKLIALILALSCTLALASCSSASTTNDDGSVNYPEDDLRILVPFAAGGALDVQVRTVAKYLQDELDCTIIVENMVGADGQLGMTEYLKEEANTDTIVLADPWLLSVTPQMSEVAFTADDYMPIIDHDITSYCLYTCPETSGIENYEDLLEYAQTDRVLFGSGGVGTSLYIIQKTMLDMMGANSDSITQNGAAEAVANMMAGTVDLSVCAFGDVVDYVENGDIVPLVWFCTETYSDDTYTEVPPASVLLGEDLTFQTSKFYAIRQGSDTEIVELLYNAFANVYNNADFRAESDQLGFYPNAMSAEDISVFIENYGVMASETYILD